MEKKMSGWKMKLSLFPKQSVPWNRCVPAGDTTAVQTNVHTHRAIHQLWSVGQETWGGTEGQVVPQSTITVPVLHRTIEFTSNIREPESPELQLIYD